MRFSTSIVLALFTVGALAVPLEWVLPFYIVVTQIDFILIWGIRFQQLQERGDKKDKSSKGTNWGKLFSKTLETGGQLANTIIQ